MTVNEETYIYGGGAMKLEPLTPAEQAVAAENHYIVERFLASRKLPPDEAQHRGPRGDQVLLPDKAFYLSQHSGACLSVQGRHAAARWSMDACQSTGVISVIR